MKKKDVLTITTVALGTAALTVASFWTRPIDAGTDPEGPAVTIVQPTLATRGLELSVSYPGKERIKAGDRPHFELKAVNTTSEMKAAKVCVAITATAPVSMLARTIPMPTVVWQREEPLTLKPNETLQIPLAIMTGMPANQAMSVQLSEGEAAALPAVNSAINTASKPLFLQQSIVAFTFSTATNTHSSSPVTAGIN